MCHEAAALFEQGRHREAIERFEAICAMDEVHAHDKAMMYVNLATVHIAAKDPRRALAAHDKAAELTIDSYAFVELSRAGCLLSMQRYEDCTAAVEKLLELRGLSRTRRAAAEELLRTARRDAVGM